MAVAVVIRRLSDPTFSTSSESQRMSWWPQMVGQLNKKKNLRECNLSSDFHLSTIIVSKSSLAPMPTLTLTYEGHDIWIFLLIFWTMPPIDPGDYYNLRQIHNICSARYRYMKKRRFFTTAALVNFGLTLFNDFIRLLETWSSFRNS